jgi:hypothetical protein
VQATVFHARICAFSPPWFVVVNEDRHFVS